MVIDAQLKRIQVIRISLLRHFQRPTFYINAIAFTGFTAWAVLQGPLYLMLVGWLPLLMYTLVGVYSAFRAGGSNQAHLLPTRYRFSDRGVEISNPQGQQSQIGWEHFVHWDKVLDCYVLSLSTGPVLAIPQEDVPNHQRDEFEAILRAGIDQRRG